MKKLILIGVSVVILLVGGYLIYNLFYDDQLEVKSEKTKTSNATFIWSKLIEPNDSDFYIFHNGSNEKLTSANGRITNVFIKENKIYYVVDNRKLYEYDSLTKKELFILQGKYKIKDVLFQPNTENVAYLDVYEEKSREIVSLMLHNNSLKDRKIVTLNGSIYEGFKLASWPSKDSIYLTSYANDAANITQKIYQVDISKKDIRVVKGFDWDNFNNSSELIGFNEIGDQYLATSRVIESGRCSEKLVKYSIGSNKGETILSIPSFLYKQDEGCSKTISYLYQENFEKIPYTIIPIGEGDQDETNINGAFLFDRRKVNRIELASQAYFLSSGKIYLYGVNEEGLLYATIDDNIFSIYSYSLQKNIKTKLFSTEDFEFIRLLGK